MVNYVKRFPNLRYEINSETELDIIDEAIRMHILKWEKPVNKNYYVFKNQVIHSHFSPTRNKSDAIYLFSKFSNIDLIKEYEKFFVIVYTGVTNPTCEVGSELTYLVEADTMELAISLAAYESIDYYKDKDLG